MFRNAGSKSLSGPKPLYQKALWLLFSAERANSYETVENRKGKPAFPLVEIEGILFLSGRKLASGTSTGPRSVYQQDKHWLVREAQESQ